MLDYALSFVSVVKAGGFTAAAKNCGISKACLSRHVAKLEEILGAPLLQRTTRSMALTEAGRKFFETCQHIEENYQAAIDELKNNFESMEGTLRVTAPIDFGIQFLPKVIEIFAKQHPKINVIVSLSNINEPIIENNYDLAIRIANQLPDSNLRMFTLLGFKRLLCASPGYFNTREIPTKIDQLSNHRCITSVNRNPAIIKPQWLFTINKRNVNYSLDSYIEVDSLFAQLELVKQGLGIGRMPDYLIREALINGELIEILPEIEKPNSYVYLLYPDSIALPRKTTIFIEYLKNILNDRSE